MSWKIYTKAIYMPNIPGFRSSSYGRFAQSVQPGRPLVWLWDVVVTEENIIRAMFYADARRPGVEAVAQLVSEQPEFIRVVKILKSKKGDKGARGELRRMKQVTGAIVAYLLIENGYEKVIDPNKDPLRVKQGKLPGHLPNWDRGALFKKSIDKNANTIPSSIAARILDIKRANSESEH